MSEVSKTIPSLNNDAWINEAIDSVKFIGDVGKTDLQFLDLILPHCTVDQLMHIEKSSKGRDLTPITNKLWKNFYERKFGKDDTNFAIERMHHKKESFKWMNLYEAKMKELENKAKKIEDQVIQTYQKEKLRKQSRQITFCGSEDSSCIKKEPRCGRTIEFEYDTTKGKVLKTTKREAQICEVPSSSNKKRRFERAVQAGHNSNKSKILKKAKRETLQSIEMKNLIAFRRNAVQKS